MSQARMKLLRDMVLDAGLEIVSTGMKNNRVAIEAKAPNSVVGTFQLSTSSRADPRGDLNEHARIKRFARNNPAPGAEPELLQEHIHMAKPQAAATTSDELSRGEFYRLCTWLKEELILAKDPESIDVLAAMAGAHMGRVVGVDTIREAMKATDTCEPVSWTKLPDPHVVLARELAAIQEALGQTPSTLFKRYLETLA